MIRRIAIVALLAAAASAQSGVLTASRYAFDNWHGAGLPGTIQYGSGGSACDGAHANCVETNPNPWTPAARVQCGSTVASGVSVATLNADIAACLPGSYVFLGTGNFGPFASNIVLRTNGVDLRAASPASTTVSFSGTAGFQFGVCCGTANGALSASSYTAGTTSVTLTGATGNPVLGQLLEVQQCNTGATGSGLNGNGDVQCTTPTYTDPGTIWVCGIDVSACTFDTPHSGADNFQHQLVVVTNSPSGCTVSCTVTFSPGLYMPNWSNANNAVMIWQSVANSTVGNGTLDFSVNFTFNTTEKFDISSVYGWRIKGMRIIGDGTNVRVSIGGHSLNGLYANNFLFGQNANNLDAGISEPTTRSDATATLGINNVFEGGIPLWGDESMTGEVWAYNYCRDTQTPYSSLAVMGLNHNPTEGMELFEGNDCPGSHEDDTHGTNNLNTKFRNYYRGWDSPYHAGAGASWAIELDNFQRFMNIIGGAYGGAESTIYQSTGTNVGAIYVTPGSDALTQVGNMFWGNCDVVNGTCRFQSSEVPNTTNMPAGTYPNATAFQNATPANNNLPCSFFLQGATFTTSPCSILPSGGTGLSWWKNGIGWSAFPSGTTSTQTQPFPPVGPDQSGGPFVNGHAYDNPAAIADIYAPVDATLQNSFPITASSFSATAAGCALNGSPTSLTPANCEILTVSMATINNGSAGHIMGRFTPPAVSGSWLSACNPAGLVNGEIYIVNSTTTQISYALPSNPGANNCLGTMSFPNIRQWDEGALFQLDSATQASSPSCTPGTGTYSSTQSVTCTNPNSGTTVMCYSTSTTPVTNGSGTGCTTGTLYSGAISVSVSETLNVVAGTSTLTDSSVSSYAYTITAAAAPSGTLSNGAKISNGAVIR